MITLVDCLSNMRYMPSNDAADHDNDPPHNAPFCEDRLVFIDQLCICHRLSGLCDEVHLPSSGG
jgi:hypothetical protein